MADLIRGLKTGAKAIAEVPSKTLKGVGIVGQAIDDVFGAPGRVATGFNAAVPSGFSQQVGNVTGQLTSSPVAGAIAGFGAGLAEPIPVGDAAKGAKAAGELTTKILDRIGNRTLVSKQFIEDLAKATDIKAPEKAIITNALKDEGRNVDVPAFVAKVKQELLPIRSTGGVGTALGGQTRYESINLPRELRGPVVDYKENVYQSTIPTSAGDVHFANNSGGTGYPNYFAHTRVEDLPSSDLSEYYNLTPAEKSKNFYTDPSTGSLIEKSTGKNLSETGTRRVIELQSDLFQKGRLDDETLTKYLPTSAEAPSVGNVPRGGLRVDKAGTEARKAEIAQLEPYQNTWQDRIIREEVKKAAQDGKTKLQFPTGDTAMKIEGLGDNSSWYKLDDGAKRVSESDSMEKMAPDNLRVGATIADSGMQVWVITDVLGDGKFNAIPQWAFSNDESLYNKAVEWGYYDAEKGDFTKQMENVGKDDPMMKAANASNYAETFDISGKVDTDNPIYKFYQSTVGKYLKNRYGAAQITDPQGVTWWELTVPKEAARTPVEAFAAIPPLAATIPAAVQSAQSTPPTNEKRQ